MAAPRSARPQRPGHSQPQYADTDSGDDTEPETPKAKRGSGLRKRVSEVSFSEDRAPLKAVNINDDAAEKRRRRKSTKLSMTENAEAGPSNGAGTATEGAAESSRQARQKQLLSVVDTLNNVPDTIPTDIKNANFEEWMKMAMDNKINAANSWNFALIDYFQDMSVLRNVNDNTINFQRASTTLDGCVKIWTSRVDSVGTETGKLLSNLANEGKGDDDEEEAGSDNPDQDPTQPRKRKANRSESTLAKSAAQLKSKKLDLEFSVDPLFRKTCEDFDEGGAHGLLMNHLSLGVGSEGGLRVVFDASDSMGKDGEDEDDIQEPEDDVDLGLLRPFIPDLDELDSRAICHSLAGFSFSKDPFAMDEAQFYREDTVHVPDDNDDEDHGFGGGPPEEFGMDVDGGRGHPEEDFFVGEQGVGDDMGGDMSPESYGEDGEHGSVGAQAGNHAVTGPGGFVPFDPRRAPNERDLVMAMTNAEADGGMMDYFDQNFLKNWAGPEHWKLRKVVRRPDAQDAAGTKPRRERKEAFKIDFMSSAEADLKEQAKELFKPVTRGAGVTLPKSVFGKNAATARKGRGRKAKEKEKLDDHTLPDDMHFSSRQLVTLFLKPNFSLKMRGQRVRLNENGDGEVDENFWAQAAAGAANRDEDEGDETGGPIPFNTQFFHDDYDDGPGFDDGFDGEGAEPATEVEPGEQDLLAATQGQSRRVRPEFVNYAKRAKRVDVRKLKENIWKGLNIVVPEPKEEDDEMETDEPPATDPSEARVFDNVISGLENSYPEDKLSEISTSFCFICLLHLANERGLKLESGSSIEEVDEESEDSKVGNIWDLKVFRDPNATPAA
ncbi:hypothetical protein EWM64_g8638 [Hericium alpestre]|uniref:Condensin complex subunit 2 n=1 Tax=Hericium alpestre TaxID=135208 RepID=A0A4Y9ZKN6_9AGAM|nr:hypothetical protein EWM64_g8638 [Hericium alpestre]